MQQNKSYAEMLEDSKAKSAALLARAATPEELGRLRSPEVLVIENDSNSSMAIGAMVWDKNFMGGAWLSRTIARNVSKESAVATLRAQMENENLKDIHIYVEGF